MFWNPGGNWVCQHIGLIKISSSSFYIPLSKMKGLIFLLQQGSWSYTALGMKSYSCSNPSYITCISGFGQEPLPDQGVGFHMGGWLSYRKTGSSLHITSSASWVPGLQNSPIMEKAGSWAMTVQTLAARLAWYYHFCISAGFTNEHVCSGCIQKQLRIWAPIKTPQDSRWVMLGWGHTEIYLLPTLLCGFLACAFMVVGFVLPIQPMPSWE